MKVQCPGNPLENYSSRREFLYVGLLGSVGMALPQFFGSRASAATKKFALHQPVAESVIHIFLPGGMSHQESFDPKPFAPAEYRGPFGAIDTKIPGIQFGQFMKETAVTEAVPFSIELESPAVPIVKNGKLMLKMRISRRADFKSKITVKFLWKPTGISTPANIDIAPDLSEAKYELNANGDAATGTWQICVVAEADTPNGRRSVSSQFVPLVIAEPYLDFSLDLAAARIGEPSALVAKIEHLRAFQGEATAELLSLPFGVTSKPVKFTKDQAEITFPLSVAANAKPGKSTGLLCKVLVPENGKMVTHLTGQGGILRIDPAPKGELAKPAAKMKPKPEVADTKAPAKPLSRLEQLRQKK